MNKFELYVGIDYSGAGLPESRQAGLQVYEVRPGGMCEQRPSPAAVAAGAFRNWTRVEVGATLHELATQGVQFLAGIDHAFSFPFSYFERYGLNSWTRLLADFTRYWPTDREGISVEAVRNGHAHALGLAPPPGQRTGDSTEFRLCERWTPSAKSVFQFGVQGQVAMSTHAGIPWLKRLRDEAGDRIHFWPFDGWQPAPGKAVIAEVYPSIFRRRYPAEGRSGDQQDAYAVARWMAEMDDRGALARYFAPPLSEEEQRIAALEGWILGVG